MRGPDRNVELADDRGRALQWAVFPFTFVVLQWAPAWMPVSHVQHRDRALRCVRDRRHHDFAARGRSSGALRRLARAWNKLAPIVLDLLIGPMLMTIPAALATLG